jgi:serine/threonine protein phosphatase PrpC
MLWNFRKNYQYTSSGMTDQGKVRDHNEDALLDKNQHGIWVVADGAGGHESGEIASNMIVDALSKIDKTQILHQAAQDIKQRLSYVNSQLIRLSGGENSKQIIASTVCVLIIRKNKCLCLWSGDSRIYLYRNNTLRLLSRDHNRIDEFIAAGFDEAALEKNPVAQQLIHAIGVSEPLFLDKQLYEIQENDLFLLCSDGLYKELTEAEIAQYLTKKTGVNKTVQSLMNNALQRGARDNVTALLIEVSRIT